MSGEDGDVLDARSISLTRDGRSILENVSLRVGRGEFVCLCGPNGGGKTTFLKTALGLLEPDSGSVLVCGVPAAEGRSHVGYVPQRTSFDRDFPATVSEVIVANLRGRWPLRLGDSERRKAREALEQVGGAHLENRPLARLSGGESQRAFLARALVTGPSLLLLDEPTAGVDAQGRTELLDLLARIAGEQRVACLMVTHSRATVERVSRRVYYLDRIVVAAGSPAEVFGAEVVGLHDHRAHTPLCEED